MAPTTRPSVERVVCICYWSYWSFNEQSTTATHKVKHQVLVKSWKWLQRLASNFDQFDQIQKIKRAENVDKNRSSAKPIQQVPSLRTRCHSCLAERLAPCLAVHCMGLHQLTARTRVSAARGLRCPIFETNLLRTG